MKCKHDLPCQTIEMSSDEWKKTFLKYYQKSRRFKKDTIYAAISVLSTNENEKEMLLNNAKKELDDPGKGNLGEAHISYYLENIRSIILTHAGWKEEPFTTVQGTDLVGVDLEGCHVVYVEVKTSTSDAPFIKKERLKELKKQLSLEKMEEKFSRKLGESSYLVVASEFKKYIRENRDTINSVPKIKKNIFLRIGAVVAGDKECWNPIIDACPCDYSDSRPCELILYLIDNLDARLKDLTAIEIFILEDEGDDN